MAITLELQQLINQIIPECERLTIKDIQVYDVKGHSPLTDVVLIATADHILQLDAARKSLSFIVKQADYPVHNPTEDHSEGWLVLDCTDLVIHILVEEKRAFYDLDSLMESVLHSRSSKIEDYIDDEKISEQEISEILEHLTPEEVETFLNDIEEQE